MPRPDFRHPGKTGAQGAFGLALAMPSVIAAFAKVMARAAGMTLRVDGALVSGGVVLRRLPQPSNGRISDNDHF